MSEKIGFDSLFDPSDRSVIDTLINGISQVNKEYGGTVKDLTKNYSLLKKASQDLAKSLLDEQSVLQGLSEIKKQDQALIAKSNEAIEKQGQTLKQNREQQKQYETQIKSLTSKITELEATVKKLQATQEKSSKTNQAAAGSIEDLRNKVNEAKKAYESLGDSVDPIAKTNALKNYTDLKQKLDAATKATQDATKGNLLAEGSYNALQKEVAELDKQYKNLPDALGKNRKEAEALRKTLFEKRQVLKDLDAQMNVYNRNVGNYAGGLKEAALNTNLFGGRISQAAQGLQNTQQTLGLVTGGFRGLGAAIAATGIGALLIVLGALVAVFTKTDAGGERLERVFAGIGAIVDFLTLKLVKLGEFLINVFDNPGESIRAFGNLLKEFVLEKINLLVGGIKGLGEAISLLFAGEFKKAAEAAGKSIIDINRGINPMVIALETGGRAVNAIGKEFGIAAKEAKRLFEAAVEIKRAMQELEDAQRVFNVTSTATRFEIDELILSSKDLNKSYEERRAALKQAGSLELDVTRSEVELARRELNNLLDFNRQNTGLTREQLLRFGTDLKAYEDYAEKRGMIGDDSLNKQAELQKKLIELEGNSAIKQQEIRNRLSKFDEAERDRRLAELKKEFEEVKKLNEGITKDKGPQSNDIEGGNIQLKNSLDEEIKLRANAYQEDIKNKQEAEAEKTRIEQEEAALRQELQQQVTALAIEIANLPFENARIKREEEMTQMQENRALDLQNAGDNMAQKDKINKEYDRRERKLKREAAVADREQALFNIAIATAVAAIKSLAATPLPAGAALLALTIALGAVQAAFVLAKPLPKFAKGTQNAPGGPAIVDEEGQEMIVRGNKGYLGSHKGARVVNLKPGDKVKTASETQRILENIMPMNVMNSFEQGHEKLSKIELGSVIDYDKLAEKLSPQFEKIARSIHNKPVASLSFKNGEFRTSVKNGNTETDYLTSKGISL